LTGHTADDQAETIILHLLRGGGPDALAGMRDEQHPLIGLRRADTEAVCQIFEWQPIEDPSNRDLRFRRNRIRHEILPLLNDVAERDVVPLLVRAGRIAEKDADLLDRLAQEIDVTDVAAVASAPIALARRAIRAWLREEHPPDLASVERVLQVARGEVLGTEITGGRSVRRTGGKLRIETLAKEHGELPESG
ncbi:MAG TPA: tRNA(Ile)-lysidine synthetase, partial [Acidimicrobiaceae bacterium]|nr:tRNA(Ile)-lysidine synthetase [Acidimicrobiaceae bacterium]